MEFGTKEVSLSVGFDKSADGLVEAENKCLDNDAARRLLSLLGLLPHGVIKMSHDLEGLVSDACFCFLLFVVVAVFVSISDFILCLACALAYRRKFSK